MIYLFPVRTECPIQWSWVTLTGSDSRDFLHRVTTVNTKSLEIGQGALGCFLNAQGKIRVYFHLWCFDRDSFAFEFDAGSQNHWKNALLAAIDQYTFAEKMTLSDLQDKLSSMWIFPTPEDLQNLGWSDLKPHQTIALEDEIRISHQGTEQFGRPWITAWGREGRLNQWISQKFPDSPELSFSQLEEWRIRSLGPSVDREITEETIPLEVGLKRAISEYKGCYPGQEVIERIISLGSPARRLSLIEGQGPHPQVGEKILNLATPPAEIGEITSVTHKDQKYWALGLVRKIHAKEGLEVQVSQTSQSRGTIAQVAPYT